MSRAEVDVDVIVVSDETSALDLLGQLRSRGAGEFCVVRQQATAVSDVAIERLVDAFDAPLSATTSPVPSSAAAAEAVSVVAIDERLPPPPTLAVPCRRVFAVRRDAVMSVEPPAVSASVTELLGWLDTRLVEAGWRHVGAPGVALDWDPARDDGGDHDRHLAVRAPIVGPSNESLATHRNWAAYDLRGPRITVDGACLTESPHNGSQKLVLNVTRALKQVRPDASVTLAVRGRFLDHYRNLVGPEGIDVVDRGAPGHTADLVYRPYQSIDPSEVAWLDGAGGRLLLGQLDMIGYSNPAYHPSSALFHAVRNLQRRMLRIADGVVFISEFGRSVAVTECPDLDPARLAVVGCGTESEPLGAGGDPGDVVDVPENFMLCLAATFWHKNRQHAIRLFAELCESHGYEGSLVIAGPAPYYGRSTELEARLLKSLPPSVAARVHMVGQIDEPTKWRLLDAARLVIYPSVVEGFGLVPFEAAAVGTPSLSYAGSGLAELLDDAPCLARTWRLDEWVELANRLLNDEHASDAAVASVAAAGSSRSWRRVAELTWTAIDGTVARPRAIARFDEAGRRARIAPSTSPVDRMAPSVHFVNRVVAALRRRLRHP